MTSEAATLRAAVVPRVGLSTDAVLVLGGAALVAASAQLAVPLPFTPVPLSGQTFAVLLVGAALGAARGVASLGVYLVAGLAGAPVYADGGSGVAALASASGGYIVGFVLAAGLVGRLAERRWDRKVSSAVAAMVAGNLVIYAAGLAWLAVVLGTGAARTLELGLYPFIPGDILKIALAAAVLPAAWRVVERSARR